MDYIKDLEDKLSELPEADFGDNVYEYNGNPVPRVTHILDFCKDQRNLIEWAAGIPEKMYYNIRNKALGVGTYVHETIDNYILYQVGQSTKEHQFPAEFNSLSESWKEEIETAYRNFISWYNRFESYGYHINKVYGVEIPLICPYFGGTADAIVDINGSAYIIDFKTSKSISFEYALQLAAYKILVNNEFYDKTKYIIPNIEGIGIIKVGKKFEDDMADFFMNDSNPIMKYYESTFISMVNTYWRYYSTMGLHFPYAKDHLYKDIFRRE